MMQLIKSFALIIGLLLPCCLLAQPDDRALIDKVVATVGGETVLLSDLMQQVSYAREQNPNLPPNFECQALQSIIITKLLVNQAKLDSIEVGDDEVENQLNARVERLLSMFGQDENAIKEYYGQSVTEIKDQMRTDMRNQLLSDRMQGEITGKATVTPSEVKAFFERIPKDSLPYFNAEVEIREIVYKPVVNENEKAIARTKAEDIRKQIMEGADFAQLAKKHSEDVGSGSQGGDLGWAKRGTYVPEFEAACYNLERNQISEVVETQFGFHILQLLERRGNLVHARHILITPEITPEDLDLAQKHLDSVRTLIVRDSLPFGVAVKRFSDKESQSYSNDGRITNPRTGNTFFETADLESDIFFAIDGLKVDEISQPIAFRSEGPQGERFFRLLQLQSRTKPHKASLKQDYNKIQQAALEERKAGFTEEWVINRLRTTYLSVDPLFTGCPNIQELLNEQ
jgi:peptidyl-prolyl cis-trans isomerase SurA